MIKLKVFWLTKYTDEKRLPLYRSVEKPENILTKNIENNTPFNCFYIINPQDSSHILNIDYICLLTAEEANIKLYASENPTSFHKSNAGDLLNFRFMNCELDKSNITELCTISNSPSLLTNKYVILLPGGSFIIRIDKPVTKAKLEIKYTAEIL